MTHRTNGTIAWDTAEETTLSDVDHGPKIVRLDIQATYSGPIEGHSTQALIVQYHDSERKGKGTGTWTGLEQLTGRIGDREGTIVIRQSGTFDNTRRSEGFHWDGTWQFEPDSGTEALAGLEGGGSLTLFHQPPHADYTVSSMT